MSICSSAQAPPETQQPEAKSAGQLAFEPDAVVTARRMIGSRDFIGAEAVLRAFLRVQEPSADAHALLGYTLMRLNQPKESLAEFTRAAEIRTPTAEDLRAVGDDYVLLSDFEDADHWMSRALLMNDKDPETWYSIGRIRYTRQRFQDAMKCFQKTLELNPRSVKAADNLGLTYEALNRTEDAVREYRKALAWQASDNHPSEQPMLNLATVLIHQGNLTEALGLLRQASAIAPEDPKIHDQLGHVYLQQNALPDAQHEFERAVALAPKSSAYHFLLGQVYRRQHMTTRAEEEFRLAADLNGTHSTAP